LNSEVGPAAGRGAPDIGAWLRDSRERAGLSLRQIADTTKFSVPTLDALERNRVDLLPDGIYRRAIVRSYAAEVGLDPEKTLQAFLAAFPQDPATFPRAMPPAASRGPGRVLRAILGAGAGILPVIAVVCYFTLIARGAPEIVPERARRVVPANVAMAGTRPDALPTAGAISVLISISSACCLQIVADGGVVLARDMDAGEVIQLTIDSEAVLSGDDAGAVHFSINGRAGRTLGDSRVTLEARISRYDYDRWLIQP
jgi:transcriptional regulator with XRE-family HTH domain